MFSVDWLAHMFGVLAVVFTAAGAGFGVASWYFSKRVSERKDTELVRFQESSRRAISIADARAAEANRGAAEANHLAAQANEKAAVLNERAEEARLKVAELERQRAPRMLKGPAFRLALRNVPKGTAIITFAAGDGEAFQLANQFLAHFFAEGWKAANPKEFDSTAHEFDFLAFQTRSRDFPPDMRVSDKQPDGLLLVIPDAKSELGRSMRAAMVAGGLGSGIAEDRRLPADTVKISVGKKP